MGALTGTVSDRPRLPTWIWTWIVRGLKVTLSTTPSEALRATRSTSSFTSRPDASIRTWASTYETVLPIEAAPDTSTELALNTGVPGWTPDGRAPVVTWTLT